ncbi:hypothetical protein D3C72_1577280 [compost metagenome]
MAAAGDFGRQRCRQIVRFIAWRVPTGDAESLERLAKLRHFLLQILRHRRTSGLIVGQDLMTPAFAAIVLVEYRHRVRWAAVLDQLLHGVLAGVDTGRPLHGVNAADEVEGVDNQ